MEGPSLHLAAEQLQPFAGRRIVTVSGNSKIGIERLQGLSVTGDYRRTGPPRLVLDFSNGEITMWAASVKFIEDADAEAGYDFTSDIMADAWDPTYGTCRFPSSGR